MFGKYLRWVLKNAIESKEQEGYRWAKSHLEERLLTHARKGKRVYSHTECSGDFLVGVSKWLTEQNIKHSNAIYQEDPLLFNNTIYIYLDKSITKEEE